MVTNLSSDLEVFVYIVFTWSWLPVAETCCDVKSINTYTQKIGCEKGISVYHFIYDI
jgi:hypothetical protein